MIPQRLLAAGQMSWLRHWLQRGLTGRQVCCPKPTRSQFISFQRSLVRAETAVLPCSCLEGVRNSLCCYWDPFPLLPAPLEVSPSPSSLLGTALPSFPGPAELGEQCLCSGTFQVWSCACVRVSCCLILKMNHQDPALLWPLGSTRPCVEKHLFWVMVNLVRQKSGIKSSTGGD